MNLTGYKRSKRGMKKMLAIMMASKKRNEAKIDRIYASIRNCSIKIKELQEARKAKKKVK